ncbi:MAG: putative ABC transporter permease [Spirochaeta sp.]|nr:putative ABC transporter permease [Spirochaeta sp.]
MDVFVRLLFYFAVYAFLGWIIESSFRSIKNQRIINSGFLYGPFIPVFGFGGLIIHVLYIPLQPLSYVPAVLILTLLVTMLEYLAGWLMERVFGLRLWDYSNYRFNLHGRIALRYSAYWLLLALVVIHGLKPRLNEYSTLLSPANSQLAAICWLVYLFIDVGLSSHALRGLRRRVDEVRGKAELELHRLRSLSGEVFHKYTGAVHDPLQKLLATGPEHLISSFAERRELRALVQHVMGEKHEGTDAAGSFAVLLGELSDADRAQIERLKEQIVGVPEYARLETLQFGTTNLLQHNERVARAAFRLSKALGLNEEASFRGALLRLPVPDPVRRTRKNWESFTRAFFHEHWHRWEPFSDTEKDIILNSTFPSSPRPPRTPEGVLVSMLALAIGIRERARERYVESYLQAVDNTD